MVGDVVIVTLYNKETIALVDLKFLICPKILKKKEAAPGFRIWFDTSAMFFQLCYISEMKSNQMHKSIFYLCFLWVIYMAGYGILGPVHVMQNCVFTEISSSTVILYLYISLAKLYHMYLWTIFQLLLSYKCGHMNHSHVYNYNTAK